MTFPTLPAWLVLVTVPLGPQEGRLDEVRGIAVAADSGEPIPSARLALTEGGHPPTTADTDAEGRFVYHPLRVLNLRARDPGRSGPYGTMLVRHLDDWTWETISTNPGPIGEHRLRESQNVFLHEIRTRWEIEDGRPLLVAECPAVGSLEFQLRDPEGRPVADRPVHLFPIGRPTGHDPDTGARLSGSTDAEGWVRLRWTEGLLGLRVVVPGVGFGATGWFAVESNLVSRPEVPRLARFGTIEGRLAPELVGQIPTVAAGGSIWGLSLAECDDEGQFTLVDVVPGGRSVRAFERPAKIQIEQARVIVAPGKTTEGIVLKPMTEPLDPSPMYPPGFIRNHGEEEPPGTWVHGTVTDPSGNPISEATVSAGASVYTGMRLIGESLSTTTDERGYFRILGPKSGITGSLQLAIVAQGKPLAELTSPRLDPDPEAPEPPPITIALADRGGSLVVSVERNGRPEPGARVWLAKEQGLELLRNLRFYVPFHLHEQKDAIGARRTPLTNTGPDGLARFDDLAPGLYRISAATQPEATVRAIAVGVAVVEGQTTRHAMALHPDHPAPRFRVEDPDGRVVRSRLLSLNRPGQGGGSTLQIDDEGIGLPMEELRPGPIAVRSTFLWVGEGHRSPEIPPYFEANARLALSPALPITEPIPLRAVRRGPASLRVQLLDADGRPARGTVAIVHSWGMDENTDWAASTDADGLVHFRGLPTGSVLVRSWLDAEDPLPLFDFDDDPADPKFQRRFAFRAHKVTLSTDEDRSIEMQAEPVAFLDATIHHADGRKAPGIFVDSFDESFVPRYHLWPRQRPDEARFRIGPLPTGPVQLHASRCEEGGLSLGPVEPELAPGVNRLDLRLPQDWTPPNLRSHFPNDPPEVHVVFENGETPVSGALAWYFSPRHDDPTGRGETDASGRLYLGSQSVSGTNQDSGSRVPSPTVVVRLPGSQGASIFGALDPGPIRAVLPPPIAASGFVTMGGRAIDGADPGHFLVTASYQGAGALGPALSVTTSAQLDGSFLLPGLTPGRYLVQASRDRIWNSASVEIRASADESIPPLSLDLPEPGAPISLLLVGPDDLPLIDRPVRVLGPEGPFNPDHLTDPRTGPDGSALLLGLPSGEVRIALNDFGEAISIDVPPFDPTSAAPVERRVSVPLP